MKYSKFLEEKKPPAEIYVPFEIILQKGKRKKNFHRQTKIEGIYCQVDPSYKKCQQKKVFRGQENNIGQKLGSTKERKNISEESEKIKNFIPHILN